MIVLASALAANGKPYSCGLPGCLPEGCDISYEGIIRHNVYKNGPQLTQEYRVDQQVQSYIDPKDTVTVLLPGRMAVNLLYFNSTTRLSECLTVIEPNGNMTLYIDASRDLGTREVAFETDDRSYTFMRDQLKNMLDGKSYFVNVKEKK